MLEIQKRQKSFGFMISKSIINFHMSTPIILEVCNQSAVCCQGHKWGSLTTEENCPTLLNNNFHC